VNRGTKLALIALALVGVLVALVFGLLSNREVTTRLGQDVLARLEKQIPADVRFEHLSINPARGTIAVDGLAVTVPGKPQEKFLDTRQVIVDVDMAALVTGKVHVQRVHLVNPEATIIHRGNNRYNFEEVIPEKKEEPKEQTSFLTLDRVTFEGGRVTYLDEPRDVDAELPHLDGSFKLDLSRNDVDGQVTLSDGWARYETFRQPIESFLADLHFDGENLHLDKLKLDAGHTGLAVQGDVLKLATRPDPSRPNVKPAPSQAPRDPELRLSAQLKTQLQQWATIAKTPMSGFASADAEIRGTVKAPRVAGEIRGTQLQVRTYKVEDLFARLSATETGADVAQLRAQAWGGKLTAAGRVPFKQTAPIDVTATATGIDLAQARRQLDLKLDGPLTGTASAHVTVRGPSLKPEALAASGWVRASGQAPVDGKPLPLVARADFSWKDALLKLADVDVRALGGRLVGRGQIAPTAQVPTYGVDARLEGLRLAALTPFLDKPLPASGTVSAEVSMTGRGFKQPTLAGSGVVRAVGVVDKGAAKNRVPLPVTATARLAFDGPAIRLKDLDARALGGRLGATGAVTLGGPKPAITLDARATGISLAELDRAFEVAKGPLTGTVDASVGYTGNALTIRQATARTLGGTLTAKGRVLLGGKDPTYAITATADRIDLAAVDRAFRFMDAPISGRAGATLAVSGTGERFRAVGPIRMQGLAAVPDRVAGLQNRLPFNVAGQVAVTPRSVALTPLTARVGESTLTARGTVQLDGRSDLTFEGRVVDAPAIAALFGVENLEGGRATFSGRATGTGGALDMRAVIAATRTSQGDAFAFDTADIRLTGRLNGGLSLDGTMAATNLVAGGQSFDRLGSPFSYRAPKDRLGQGMVRLNALEAVIDDARVRGTATVDLRARTYDMALTSDGLTLGHLDALQAQEGGGIPLGTGVKLDARGKGALSAPTLNARFDIAPFTFRGRSFGATSATASLQNQNLTVNGDVFARQVDLKGRIGLGPNQPGEVTVRFNDTQLGALMSLVPAGAADAVELPVDGALTGTVTIKGPFTRAARLTADVDLSKLSLAYDDLTLQNEGPVRLRYGQNRVTLTRFHLVGPGTDLTARGVVGLGVPSSLSASGKLNLALIEKVAPKNLADSSGTATIDAQLRGTLGRPDVTGALTIRNGEFATRNLPQPVRDLNGSIRLVRDRIFLDNMRATLGYTGRVQAFGGATLGPDLQPTYVNLELTAREIEARIPDVDVLLNADLAFSGTPDSTRLDGQVRVLQGKITRDVDLTGGLLAGPKGGQAAPSALGGIPFLKNMALRTQVLVPDQFFIDNNLAKGELRGDVLVLGTLARPIAVGRVETISGQVFFQDNTYTLEEASVDLIDPYKLTPYMHVVATTTIQGIDVNVNVNGTPDQFKLNLSSTPFYPEQDLLTLIATGQTPAQLAGGGEGVASAGNFLLNRITSGVEKGVTQQGVVDVLRIQPGTANPTETTGGSFTVGKRLSEKLMVTYTQDLLVAPGQTPGRLILFDYLLTDQIVLKLEQRLGGGFNASARYRFTLR
jgi:autotransporter translocation and assembly factor TamB